MTGLSDIYIKGIRYRIQVIQDHPHNQWMIFLHDSLGCIKTWKTFPQKFADLSKLNILIYDRQGYGDSDTFDGKVRSNDYLEKEANVLIDILSYQGIEKPILFGHSDGGSIALIAAAKYKEYIKGIITVGAHVLVEEITITGINKAKEAYEYGDLKKKLLAYHGANTERMFYAWTDTWLSESFKSWNIEGLLPQIECSKLIIQGEFDEYGTIEHVNSITRNTRGKSQTFIVRKSWHSPHRDNPSIVLCGCLAFLENL